MLSKFWLTGRRENLMIRKLFKFGPANSQSKKRPWGWWILWLAFVLFVPLTDSIPPAQAVNSALGVLTAGKRFDWITWEAATLRDEAGWWLNGRPLDGAPAGQKAQVLAYIARQEDINRLEEQIEQGYALLPEAERVSPSLAVATQEAQLAQLRQQQEAETPAVERILAAQVASVLRDEGFSVGNEVWPPVTFRFVELPTLLILSPRAEIRTYKDYHLLPAMPVAERERLEKTIETDLNLSALVENLGGIGSWPTMVARSTSLNWLVSTIAHEWSHTYLLLRPLGLHYEDNRDLKTMNETVAELVGEEIAGRVLERYYPELLAPAPETVEPAEETKEPETFNQAMRRIRLRVDDLLAEGQVEEAESYMETERQKLAENGYYLRRLNQAYFAFHGSYAAGSASVDPIGPWMRQLRRQNPSLKAFVEQAANMQSLADLTSALKQ